MLKRLALLVCLFSPCAAYAQALGGSASISATVTSASVALPASTSSYPAVLIAPAVGTTSELFYAFGVTAPTALNTGPALPASGLCFPNIGPNKFVAALSGTTGTLRITQLTQCPVAP